jgi:RNA polymerase sigma factor (sigma-70 family)
VKSTSCKRGIADLSDADLIHLHHAGDKAALAHLYERHTPRQQALCRRWFEQHHVIEEVIAGARVRIWQALYRYRDDYESAWPLISRCTVRAAKDYLRKEVYRWQRRCQPLDQVPDMPAKPAPSIVEEGWLATEIERLQSELDRIDQVILEMRLNEYTFREISQRVGLQPAALRKRFERNIRPGLESLQDRLG